MTKVPMTDDQTRNRRVECSRGAVAPLVILWSLPHWLLVVSALFSTSENPAENEVKFLRFVLDRSFSQGSPWSGVWSLVIPWSLRHWSVGIVTWSWCGGGKRDTRSTLHAAAARYSPACNGIGSFRSLRAVEDGKLLLRASNFCEFPLGA